MANDKPVTRKERFLAGAAGEDITLDTPITREERFLAKAAGMDVKTDDPVTRSEKYLAKIAEGGGGGGGDIPSYTGSYTVTPSEQTQTLATNGKQMTDDVTVNPIPSTYIGSGVTQKAAATYTPTTSDQTIAANQYLSGAQTVKGDANLVAGNIKKDTQIFGVTGTYEGSGGGGEPPQPELKSNNALILIDVPYDGFGITVSFRGGSATSRIDLDWGDDSEPSSQTSGNLSFQHIYQEKGMYWIEAVSSDAVHGFGTYSSGGSTPAIAGYGNTTPVEAQKALKKLLSNGFKAGADAFAPYGTFWANVTINGFDEIYFNGAIDGGSAFSGCPCARKITLGESVHFTSNKSSVFTALRSAREIIFLKSAPFAIPSSGQFSYLNESCIIVFPFSGLSDYVTATNYPAPATYTYIGFATYESGATLPTQDTTEAYNVVWYASKADAIAQTNPITVGNGNEIYCRYTAV